MSRDDPFLELVAAALNTGVAPEDADIARAWAAAADPDAMLTYRSITHPPAPLLEAARRCVEIAIDACDDDELRAMAAATDADRVHRRAQDLSVAASRAREFARASAFAALAALVDAERVIASGDPDALAEDLPPSLSSCVDCAASALALLTLDPVVAFGSQVAALAAAQPAERAVRERLAEVVRSAIPTPTRAELAPLFTR